MRRPTTLIPGTNVSAQDAIVTDEVVDDKGIPKTVTTQYFVTNDGVWRRKENALRLTLADLNDVQIDPVAVLGDSYGYDNLPPGYDFTVVPLRSEPDTEQSSLADGTYVGVQSNGEFRSYTASGTYSSGSGVSINDVVQSAFGGSVNLSA